MAENKFRRAPSDETELPFSFEYDSEGKLHLYFDSDVEFHYKGNKAEEIDGDIASFTKGDSYQVTQGALHLNPWGAEFYDKVISHIIDNDELRMVMEAKLELQKEIEKRNRKVRLKDRINKYNYNRRLRKSCNCNG